MSINTQDFDVELRGLVIIEQEKSKQAEELTKQEIERTRQAEERTKQLELQLKLQLFNLRNNEESEEESSEEEDNEEEDNEEEDNEEDDNEEEDNDEEESDDDSSVVVDEIPRVKHLQDRLERLIKHKDELETNIKAANSNVNMD